MQFFDKVFQCHSNRDTVEQLQKSSPDSESAEQVNIYFVFWVLLIITATAPNSQCLLESWYLLMKLYDHCISPLWYLINSHCGIAETGSFNF